MFSCVNVGVLKTIIVAIYGCTILQSMHKKRNIPISDQNSNESVIVFAFFSDSTFRCPCAKLAERDAVVQAPRRARTNPLSYSINLHRRTASDPIGIVSTF